MAAQTRAERCLEPAEQTQFFWIISGVALLLAAAAIYWAMPALKIRRDSLLLTNERAPGGRRLPESCVGKGLSGQPTLSS